MLVYNLDYEEEYFGKLARGVPQITSGRVTYSNPVTGQSIGVDFNVTDAAAKKLANEYPLFVIGNMIPEGFMPADKRVVEAGEHAS